ncbi:MAG TPA: hypothetical protein DIT04_11925 [Dysgonomonas sp.]|nr:hypothetical protein [Dysgonomonas sp.]
MKISEQIRKMKPGNYLRELSIVIIGVAITLFASDRISSYNEQRDMHQQLDLVYEELSSNLVQLDEVVDYYNNLAVQRKHMLAKYRDPYPGVNDSIMKYDSYTSSTFPYTYKKSAYEMFINSGAMKQLTDRKQLMDITQSYSGLENLKDKIESYMQSKKEVMHELYKIRTEDAIKYELTDPQFYIIYNFHMLNSGLEETTSDLKKEIERVISERP